MGGVVRQQDRYRNLIEEVLEQFNQGYGRLCLCQFIPDDAAVNRVECCLYIQEGYH